MARHRSNKKLKQNVPRISRRTLLGAGAGTAAGSLLSSPAIAQENPETTEKSLNPPSAAEVERDVGNARPLPIPERAAIRPGSDLMVQVLRDLGVEFVASNPGSSFEGLQESIVNFGDPPNVMPEFISAMHEESAVDMAHGYAKAEGKPMVALLHGTIGLQHASMAIYQAYHDRTPVVLIAGRDDTFFIQSHSADDMAGIVRAYTKWDAQPRTLEESLLAIQQAYREAMTPPYAPTLVVLDAELQKEEAGDLEVPSYTPPVIPIVDTEQAGQIASGLLGAQNPRIRVGRLLSPKGVSQAVELAELVGTSVESRAAWGPMSFPQRHPLVGPGSSEEYDFELGLEAPGADFSLLGPSVRTIKDRDVTDIGFGGIRERSRGVMPAGMVVPGLPGNSGGPGANDLELDAEASLPSIIEETRKARTQNKATEIAERTPRLARANHAARVTSLEQALEQKRPGWDGTPISTARIYAELWPLLIQEDWCLSSPSTFSGSHHADLWDHDKPYSYLGGHGAAGVGYGIGASVGAALAARDRGRIVINIQCDGDLNYAPGSLWTAAHHDLPLLTIMHNNRAWHQELMFLQYMAGVRGRGTDRMRIGSAIDSPHISYAKMAESYGIDSEGPISDPTLLADALRRGVETVKQGKPYLIDVLTQPR